MQDGLAVARRKNLFCGFLHCDAAAFGPLLASLPRLLVVRSFADGASALVTRGSLDLTYRDGVLATGATPVAFVLGTCV